ncbi:MAG TPA: acetyl-CoA hydrolase/transferase C-terminal domain-containing protein [Rhizomicrobium sp.]
MPRTFTDPEAIADAVIAQIGRKIVLGLPLGLGKANHIANALYGRAVRDPTLDLHIFTALTLEAPRAGSELERRFLDPVAERLFAGYPPLDYARDLHRGALPPNVRVDEFFFLAGNWLGSTAAQRSYISANYTQAAGYLLARGVNVVAQLVAGRGDRFSLSCNPDLTLDLLDARAAGRADFLLLGQVNSELPFMPGDGDLAADNFAMVLDSPSTDFPLFGAPKQPISTGEYAGGLNIARLIADGGTLQIGIGAEGEAAVHAMILRHREPKAFCDAIDRLTGGAAPLAIEQRTPFVRGLYGVSEMLVDGFLELIDAGILTRAIDGILVHGGFFLGSRDFYRRLREMAPDALARIAMTRISFTNALYGDEAAKRAARVDARFVNNAMMATLLGAVISDGLEDGRVVSGVGGQFNFVDQAFALDGARSIIAVNAARGAGRRARSNIRWSYGHATIPRHLRDIVVSEYGIADLRGKSDEDVVAAMLAIADSRFQGDLLARAKDAGKIARDYAIPAAHRENHPERIAQALAPLRACGLLPDYPFGTEFTPVEQRLLAALGRLKDAAPLALARFAAAGLSAAPREDEPLARMGLARPRSMSERLYRALLRGALKP